MSSAPSFKFILIGESGTGKTSLVTRLIKKKFDPKSVQTVGADYFEYTTSIDNRPVQLVIWDTAGQERFYTIVKSYYRMALGILVVFDITDRSSFDNIPRWLRDARQEADPNCQVLLVGNKSDMAKNRAISSEEAKHFADENMISYIETSALSNENVEEAFLNLATDIFKKTVTGQISTSAYQKKVKEPKEKKEDPCCV
ncbi:GTP-binding protein ypt3 [Tritrichomonas foetus]|uniref:GTP-binding protein ypt3 n=1 Tax=Tritrichomonas foetus TaxID=1144522 RepID=A0A1J4KT59_9EUKA|nr:GTP-binding protein ypt3 [Tritrichomonas foetus]|eukprot:OHT14479.1 GTP-binding protein ypt3 [Tritrichomonas foetus]